jgi:acid phosphatase (class A)
MRLALSATALLLLSSAAVAMPAKDKLPSLLTPADLDPQAVLPPPPTAGSTQAVAELAELHAMEQRRSAADMAAAKLDGDTKNPTIFAEVLGPSFDLANLPATKQLFEMVRATEKAVVDRGKDEFKRPRPWIVDPALQSCAKSDEPLSSYPSGHTSMAFSMAGVLAQLVPDKANAIMTRAARYGESRIVCEQHFRSDVTAGEALGLLIADRLMAKPDFRTAFDAARRELAAAGIVRTA